MKLVVFTPAVKTSAIGRMATLVVQALAAQGHQVVVVRTEDISHLEAPIHAFGVEVVRWDDTNRVGALTRTADLVVYQIGNSFQFHRGCLEWLPTLPGVVCLHDYFLGGLFWSWATPANRVLAQAILQAWYGEAIAANFFNHRCSKDFIEATWNKAPMTEWIASMATGVITHSSWDIERIVKQWKKHKPISEIAKYFGVTRQWVHQIVNRYTRSGTIPVLHKPGRRTKDITE